MIMIRVLPTGTSPDFYEFFGETIIINGEEFDLSALIEGSKFNGIEVDNVLNSAAWIRQAYRSSEDGLVYAEICQAVGAGHWLASDWFSSGDYDPNKVYVQLNTQMSFTGQAWAKTKEGKTVVGYGQG